MSQLSVFSRNDYEGLLKLVNEASVDAEKYYHKNNKAAGTRLAVKLRAIELAARAARHGIYKLNQERATKSKPVGV